MACQHNSVPVVRLLLEARADQDQRLNCGAASLVLACRRNFPEVTHLFLKSEVEVEVDELESGPPPLFIACIRGHAKVVQLLLQARANRDQCTGGMSCLDIAQAKGHSRVADLLLKCKGSSCQSR